MTKEELDQLKCVITPDDVYGEGWQGHIPEGATVQFRTPKEGETILDVYCLLPTPIYGLWKASPRLVLTRKSLTVTFKQVGFRKPGKGEYFQHESGTGSGVDMYVNEYGDEMPPCPVFARTEEETEVPW